MQDNEIYKFMKANGLTDKDQATFLNEYSNPKKAKEVFDFFKANQLTDKDETSFYDTYLKKKEPIISSATPSRLPKISEQVSPLQQGANIVSGGVIGDISKTVPKSKVPQSIAEGVQKDKKNGDSYWGGMYNMLVGSIPSFAGGLNYMAAALPSVGKQRPTDKTPEQLRQMTEALGEKFRTSSSTRENERQRSNIDITDGSFGLDDLSALAFQAPRTLVDMGLGALTSGTSFFAQSVNDNSKDLEENPNASKLTPTQKLAYLYTTAAVTAVLEKYSLDKLFKGSGVTKKYTQQITKEIIDDFAKRGIKATAKEIEQAAAKKASSLSQKLLRGGKSTAESFLAESTTEGLQSASGDAIKIITNKLKGEEVFDEKDIAENFWKNTINASAVGGIFGGFIGGGASALSNTNKAIRKQVSEAQTPEELQKVQDELNTQVELGNITPEEAQKANITAQQYAEIAGKIPQDIPQEKKYDIIGGIEQREKIKRDIEALKADIETIDEAFPEYKQGKLDQVALLEGKALQVNDYIDSILNGVKPTYVKDGKKFYKIYADGRKMTKTEIPENHYIAGKIVEEGQKKQAKEQPKEEIVVKEEEIQQPIEEQLPNQVEEDVVENANKLNKEAGIDLFAARKPIEIKGEKFVLSQIKENNNDNSFIVENEKGEEIGKAQLSADGNFLENIRIDEKYRRKGLATQIYNFIEDRKGINLQPSPVKQSKEVKALWDKRRKIEDLQPEIVKSVRVEQEPELPEGTKVVTLSGMDESERNRLVEERKKKTTLTEKETLHNDLIDLANRVQKARGNEKTNLQGQIRQKVRELNAKAGEEIYRYDGVSVRAKVKSKTKGERYLKIKGTTRDTSGRAIKEDAVLLFDRSPEFVQKYEELADSPNITALQVDSGNGVTMTAEQIESALQDIADGIPSVQADNLLNALEEGFNRGYFDLRGKDIGQDRVQASVEDFIGVQQEEVGQPMDEEALMEYLNDESQFSPEEDEQISEDLKNLINEYESQPQKAVIEGEVPKAKPAAEVGSPKPTQPNEKGKADGEPKADISKEPIGEAKPKQEDVEPKSPLEQQYEEASQKKGEKAQQKAKEKLISDNFDGIVAQLMTKNKIKRKC